MPTPYAAVVRIRAYADGDAEETLSVFVRAVHHTASADYSVEQVAAWAPVDLDLVAWHQRRQASETLVAVVGDRVAGFTDLDASGYVDMLFVDPDFARQGVASELVGVVTSLAQRRGIVSLTTYASLTARPFFERQGFVVTEERRVTLRGVALTNFAMRRDLSPCRP